MNRLDVLAPCILPGPTKHHIDHPASCDEAWCLAQPDIACCGHVHHWGGTHRGGVEAFEIKFGHLAEVGVARTEDFTWGGPQIHLLVRGTQGTDAALETFMDPAEARRIGQAMVDAANYIETYPENFADVRAAAE